MPILILARQGESRRSTHYCSICIKGLPLQCPDNSFRTERLSISGYTQQLYARYRRSEECSTMPLWIHQNQYVAKVIADLSRICTDPGGITVDAAGRVSYTQAVNSQGCSAIAYLAGLG